MTEPADPAPGPDEKTADRSELRAVIAALQQLPEIDRAALLMWTLEELPYESIAAALGLSTARSGSKSVAHGRRSRLGERSRRKLSRPGLQVGRVRSTRAMTKITRDVITDLWPLYESGEASRDTRTIVDEFLAGVRSSPGRSGHSQHWRHL